jgi:prepilin-type N-terminal cleavage/methylation domain-containing protein
VHEVYIKQLIQNGIKLSNNDKGFTIIEVMIALVIFSFGILGLAKLQITAVNGNAKAREYSEASAFAQGQIESLMSTPFANIVNSNPVNADGYRIQTTILSQTDLDADGDNDIMTIEVRVFDPSNVERGLLTFLKAADI